MEGFTAAARWFGGHGCSRRGVVAGLWFLIGPLATGCGVDTAGAGARLSLDINGAGQPEGLSTGLMSIDEAA